MVGVEQGARELWGAMESGHVGEDATGDEDLVVELW